MKNKNKLIKERNPAHYCFNCNKYLGFRGFCSKKCHDEWYDKEYLSGELKDIKPTSENKKPLKINGHGKKALEELGFKVDRNEEIKEKVLREFVFNEPDEEEQSYTYRDINKIIDLVIQERDKEYENNIKEVCETNNKLIERLERQREEFNNKLEQFRDKCFSIHFENSDDRYLFNKFFEELKEK